jgi:hypothetical protein
MQNKKRINVVILSLIIFCVLIFILVKLIYEKPNVIIINKLPLQKISNDGKIIDNSFAYADIQLTVRRKIFESKYLYIQEGIVKISDNFYLPEKYNEYQTEVDSILQDGRTFSVWLPLTSLEQNELNFSFRFNVPFDQSKPEKTNLVISYNIFLLINENYSSSFDQKGNIELSINAYEESIIYHRYTCDLREITTKIIQMAR